MKASFFHFSLLELLRPTLAGAWVELIVGMVYGHDELRFHPPSAELELILPDLGLS